MKEITSQTRVLRLEASAIIDRKDWELIFLSFLSIDIPMVFSFPSCKSNFTIKYKIVRFTLYEANMDFFEPLA